MTGVSTLTTPKTDNLGTAVPPIRVATTKTMEDRIEVVVRRPRYVAPSTGLDADDDDAVGYVSSLLAEEAGGIFAHGGEDNEEARENLVQIVAQFLGGDEYLPHAAELVDEVARLFLENDDKRRKNGVVSAGANGAVGGESDDVTEKPTRFDQALSLSSCPSTQPKINSKIKDEEDDDPGDVVVGDSLEKIPEEEEEEQPTTIKKKSKAGKHHKTSKARRKGKDRHKQRNHHGSGSSDSDEERESSSSAAERVRIRSALELEDLDDSSSAWAECVAEGRAWGGRGAGGRGLRNQHTTSTAVRSVHLSNVSLQFGGNDLLQNATIQLTEGKRYGLIGRNGVGKSTLLRRLANKMIPGFPMHMRVLLVHQQVDGSDKSAIQTLLDADEGRGALLAEQARLEDRLDSLADGGQGGAEGGEDDIATVAEALNEVMEELDAIDADTAEERARSILRGLQFTDEMQDSPTNHLSGGWRMRLALAQSLFVPTDLLLLDEPTNHLDLFAVLWLAEHLVKSGRTIVVVSHDRAFLDDVCTDVINFEHQKLKYHPGNFSAFEQQRSEKAARESHILDAAERKREKAVQFIEKQQRQLSHGGKRGHDPNKQRQAKMMRDKKLDRIGTYREDGKKFKNFSLKTLSEDSFRMGQKVVVEADEPALRFKLPDPSWSPGMKGDAALVSLEDVSFDYDPSSKKNNKTKNPGMPGSSPFLLNGMTLNVHPGSKIALVGRNGAGKSTLLKVMIGNVDATKGTVWRHPTLRVGHVTQHSVEELDPYAEMTVVEYMRNRLSAAEEAGGERFTGTTSATRTYLGAFGLGGNRHANRLIGSLSGGERMRLCFATVFTSRPHIIFLDEPSNHLDLETLDALATALEAFKGAVVIISHNQRFLCGFCNELWVVEDGHVDVKHSDTSSFEENFAKYRSVAVQGIQSRSSSRQARAFMAKQATRQRAGAAQSTGFVG